MQKLFSLFLLTLTLSLGISNVWADDVFKSDFTNGQTIILSRTYISDNSGDGKWLVKNTTSEGTVTPPTDPATGEAYSGDAIDCYRIKQWGSRYVEFHVTGVTSMEFFVHNPNNSSTRTAKATVNQTSETSPVTIVACTNGACGSGSVTLNPATNNKVRVYADADMDLYAVKITIPTAQAPVFSPVSGSSIAEGSKISLTSQYSTSIKYKWTASNETPADGWSTYDVDEKVTVPASSDGTPYLHAQGFRGEVGGTAGFAQYTITAPDTEAPSLSSTSPADAATDIPASGNIILTFNENVDCTTNATLTPEGGDAIELTPVVDGTTVTYAYDGLSYTKAHTFNLAANSVEDVSGNKYASAISFGFTTAQEPVATPTFTVYGNKVVKIECATDGATIYYGGSDVKTGTKTEYTELFMPASSGTIYAYATKTGAVDSEVASKAVTLPVVPEVTGNLLMTLQPDIVPSTDTDYDSNTFSKAGYTMVSDAKITNTAANTGFPNMFKAAKGTITITPPSDVTIQSIKIYGVTNGDAANKLCNIQKTTNSSGSTVSLINRNIKVAGVGIVSEAVLTAKSASEGGVIDFKIGGDVGQARIFVEVYGTTSATEEEITPAKTYTTYVPNHDLNFTSHASLSAYIATEATNSTVTLASVNKIPAGTPIIIKATATGSAINVPIASSTLDDVSSNLLKCGDGTTNMGGESRYDYVLSNGTFYRAEEGTVAVGKAYLHLDSAPSPSPELRIVFEEDNATDIKDLKANENVVKFIENGQLLIKRDGVVYDAFGRVIR